MSEVPRTLGDLKAAIAALGLPDDTLVGVAHGDYGAGPGIELYVDRGKGREVLTVIELEI